MRPNLTSACCKDSSPSLDGPSSELITLISGLPRGLSFFRYLDLRDLGLVDSDGSEDARLLLPVIHRFALSQLGDSMLTCGALVEAGWAPYRSCSFFHPEISSVSSNNRIYIAIESPAG